MPNPVVMLPLDLTGLEPGNRRTNEPASIGVGQMRLIIPVYHPFFRESLTLVDNATGSPLTDDQFFCTDMDRDLTMRSAKEVYTNIVIKDSQVSPDVRLTYQSTGGPYARDRQALIDWLEDRKNTGGTEDWDNITDKPKLYNPDMSHKHLLAHIYGMEYVVAGLKRVEEAVYIGDNGAYSKIQQTLDRLMARVATESQQITTDVINARINGAKDSIGKDALGLGLLENLSPLSRDLAREIAKPSYAIGPDFVDHYTTILGLDAFNEQLQTELVSRFNTGLGDTKGTYIPSTRPSLLVLPNGAVFTLRSKKAIIDNDDYYDANVYPPDTSEGDEFVITRITNSLYHSGGIFMLFNKSNQDTYIGNLSNDGCRTQIVWRKMYFDSELDELNKLIQAHIVDTKNPHNLTPDDVDLEFVENLPVITTDEIDAKKSARKYLTLDTLYYYMKKFMTNAQPPAPPGSTVDPNKPTMDQAQIIFTSCRKPPPDAVHPNKGRLINTYCDGTDKFGKYTDGAGGYYDEVIELNSDDCDYKVFPSHGTLINTFCDGVAKKGKYANGTGGDYVETIDAKSEDCGYEAPPAEGTVIAVFCSGVDKVTRYADGRGGSYDMPSELYSPDCMLETPAPPPPTTPAPPPPTTPAPTPPTTPAPTGTSAPPTPNLALSVSPNALSVGQTATVSVNASSLVSGRRYVIKFYRKHINQSSPQQYASTVSFTASGSTYSSSFSVTNGGDYIQGASNFTGEIQLENDANSRNTSNAVQVTFYANRSVSLLLEGSTSFVTVTIGQNVEVRNEYRDFPIPGLSTNGIVIVGYEITGAEDRYAGPFQITMDSSGSDSRIGYSTLALNMDTRGRVNYRIRAEWTDATGQRQTTYSNYVTINWVGGAAAPPPPTTTAPPPTTTAPPPPSGPVRRALNYQSNEGNGTCDAVFDPNSGTVVFYWSGTTHSIHNNNGGTRTVLGAYNGSGVLFNPIDGVLYGMTLAIFNSLSYMRYTFTLGDGGGG